MLSRRVPASENWAERRRMARLKAVSRYSATWEIRQLHGICWHPVECATDISRETHGDTAQAIVRSSLSNLSGMGAFLFRPEKETMYRSNTKESLGRGAGSEEKNNKISNNQR